MELIKSQRLIRKAEIEASNARSLQREADYKIQSLEKEIQDKVEQKNKEYSRENDEKLEKVIKKTVAVNSISTLSVTIYAFFITVSWAFNHWETFINGFMWFSNRIKNIQTVWNIIIKIYLDIYNSLGEAVDTFEKILHHAISIVPVAIAIGAIALFIYIFVKDFIIYVYSYLWSDKNKYYEDWNLISMRKKTQKYIILSLMVGMIPLSIMITESTSVMTWISWWIILATFSASTYLFFTSKNRDSLLRGNLWKK